MCDSIFCDSCWQLQLCHKKARLAPGLIPHERTDATVAQKIKTALEPGIDMARQESLHGTDENTKWFGIFRDDGTGLPLFRDYGRFARIMAERQILPSNGGQSWAFKSQELRFPSLVSFVGQTGLSAILPSVRCCLIAV